MRICFILIGLLLCPSVSSLAQNRNQTNQTNQPKLNGRANVTGKVIDYSTTEDLPLVAIQLFSLPDTSFVVGTVTDNEGWFSLKKVDVGNYFLRMSFLGYSTIESDVTVEKNDREKSFGIFKLRDDAIMLGEAVIEETLPPTQVVNDTLMFNTSAFRVPEGSVLEDLIKQLPGVEVDENGGITVNGKTISRILVDGKEYFGNDRRMATQNLPVNIIQRIKTYQRKSDLARVTGVDDGEEETVMDLQIRPNMRRGWLNNADGGLGTPVGHNEYGDWLKYLYSGRYTLNRFQSDTQFSVTANTNNSGRGNGVSESTQLGVNFSKNIGEQYPRRRNEYPLVLGGNIRWNGSSSRSMNEFETETFTTQYTSSSYSNNRSNNSNGSNSASGDFRFEWRPDSSLNIIFRPSFSLSRNNSNSNSRSVTFNADPYIATDMVDILDEYIYLPTDVLDSIGVNSRVSANKSKGKSNQLNSELQFNKRFTEDGRNLTLRFTYSANGGENNSYSSSNQIYYQKHERDTVMNRYNMNPTDNSNWSGRVMWSEPMDSGRKHLQISYQVQTSKRTTDRQTYVLPSSGEIYENWAENWLLPYELEQYLNSELSRKATNLSRNHDITLQYSHTTDHSNLNVGFSVLPQYTHMDNFQYLGHSIPDTSRLVFNWTPTLNYRYRWTQQKSIQVTYRANTSQPSMEDMLDITDDSNPLNITKGNPGLLPTLINTFEVNFNDYKQENKRTFNIRVSLDNYLRNIARRTDYDPQTGVSITQPQNMEGFWTNWNTSTNIQLNQTIPNTKWRYSTTTNGSFRHQESYMRTGSIGNYNEGTGTGGNAVLSKTKSITVGEYASVTYRNTWLEASAIGRFNYSHQENSVRQNSNMDTYTFSYGAIFNARLPWQNINLGSDIKMQSRRGYRESSNRDDLIWNASASFSFLKGNAATLRINYYDILNDESNVNRDVTTIGITDTKNNNINSYIMANLILRVNVFGTRQARQELRNSSPRTAPSGGFQGGGGMRGGMRGGMGGGMGGAGAMGGGFGGRWVQ